MSKAHIVKDYFDSAAGRYSDQSSTGIWQLQRNRELAAVGAFLGNVKGLDILDLGCGAGFYTYYCLDQGAREVTAVDFSPRMIEQLPREMVRGIVADATVVQLEKQFPKIICAGLLEFVASLQEVLANARRLVAPAGIMVCLVPPDNLAGRLYQKFHQSNGVNISLFSKLSFGQQADQAGWRVDSHKFVFPYTSVYRLKARRKS